MSASEMTPEESRSFLISLPGYPVLPDKICGGTGSCDHIGWERARAWHPSLIDAVHSDAPSPLPSSTVEVGR